MDRSLSLLLLFSLLFAVASADVDAADPLIRQVVDGADHHHHHDEPVLGAEHHFSMFKHKYGKSYASQEEHDFRFQIFKNNMRRARRHQRMDPTAQHGVTRFMDLTPAEFRKSHLGLRGLKILVDANTTPKTTGASPEIGQRSRSLFMICPDLFMACDPHRKYIYRFW